MARMTRIRMVHCHTPYVALRPHAKYKVNDHWTVEAGGNLFLGESNSTFFGQFEDNTNVYAGARWSF